ncbi:MAG: hypothetical protein WDN26_20650 [Chitinophagaceae bacterium]
MKQIIEPYTHVALLPLNPKTHFFLSCLNTFADRRSYMYKILLPFLLLFFYSHVHAQQGKRSIRITLVNEQKNTLPGSTVYLLTPDSWSFIPEPPIQMALLNL